MEEANLVDLLESIVDLLESIVGVEGEGKVKIKAAFRVGQYKKNVSRPREFSDWAS